MDIVHIQFDFGRNSQEARNRPFRSRKGFEFLSRIYLIQLDRGSTCVTRFLFQDHLDGKAQFHLPRRLHNHPSHVMNSSRSSYRLVQSMSRMDTAYPLRVVVSVFLSQLYGQNDFIYLFPFYEYIVPFVTYSKLF